MKMNLKKSCLSRYKFKVIDKIKYEDMNELAVNMLFQ